MPSSIPRAKLMWRCRRGMREMDLTLLAYLKTNYDTATQAEQQIFVELLEENDSDLFAWLIGKTPPHDRYLPLIQSLRHLSTVGI